MLTFKQFINESISDIHGKVVGIDELRKHLNKTQMNNLTKHQWYNIYATFPGKPSAYRVQKHPTLDNTFSIEVGHGQPRDKETFSDPEEIRHMVAFHFYKNKVENADLYRNRGNRRHPETGRPIWEWKRAHKEYDPEEY
jgi:hypothetical protein